MGSLPLHRGVVAIGKGEKQREWCKERSEGKIYRRNKDGGEGEKQNWWSEEKSERNGRGKTNEDGKIWKERRK